MQDLLSTTQEAPSALTLKEYLEILRRRRAIILQTFVIVLVIGILVNLYTPLTFSASGRLVIEAPRFSINQVNTSDPLSEIFSVNQQYNLLTQVQMMQTAEIKNKVREKMALDKNIPLPLIRVAPIEGTQIIEVTTEGDNADLVARTANALLEVYRDQQIERSGEKAKKALDMAEARIKSAKEAAEKLESDLKDFKIKYDLIELKRNKDEQLGRVESLENALAKGRSDLAVIRRKMESIRNNLATMSPTNASIISTQADPRLQVIDDRLVDLDIQIKALDEEWLPGSAPRNRLEKQLELLEKRKQELVRSFKERTAVRNPVYADLETELLKSEIEATARAQEVANLVGQLQAARERLQNFPDWEKRFNEMTQQLEKERQQLAYFSTQKYALDMRSETSSAQGPIILQQATVPQKAIRPNREQNILFAGLLGLFFGLCLALLQEMFDDRINSPDEAERLLRVPSLGMIPMIEEEGLRLIKDTSTYSPLMESYRTLRTNINFAAVGAEMRSIVVTSSVAAEGKSTTVANLAMAMALEGKRVVIVDADLRRPSLHRLFKIDVSPGLTDVLVHPGGPQEALREALRPTGVENVSVLTAGSIPPNPAELLGSNAMGDLMLELEKVADIILFDSPPVMVVADGVVLASRANGVLLVIAYGETKKASTRKAIDILTRASANVLGTVLNRMESGGPGYYNYYYTKYYVPITDSSRANGAKAGNGTSDALTGSEPALPDGGQLAPTGAAEKKED